MILMFMTSMILTRMLMFYENAYYMSIANEKHGNGKIRSAKTPCMREQPL